MLLAQVKLTRKRFLTLTAEERFRQIGKKLPVSPHNLEMLFKPQLGRKGLAKDWREAGMLVLSQRLAKLGLAYGEVLKLIFSAPRK